MKCSKCGFENKADSRFCLMCGNRLVDDNTVDNIRYSENEPIQTDDNLSNRNDENNISNENAMTGKNISDSKTAKRNKMIAAGSVVAAVIGVGSILAVALQKPENGFSVHKFDEYESNADTNQIMSETLQSVESVTTHLITTAAETTTSFETTTFTESTTSADVYQEYELNFDSESLSYKDIYANFLANTDTNEYMFFELYDLDLDGIPELFLSRGMAHMSQVDIYSINKDKQLILLAKDYGAYGYVPTRGCYILGWKWMMKSGDELIECPDDIQEKMNNDSTECDDIGYKYELNDVNIRQALSEFEDSSDINSSSVSNLDIDDSYKLDESYTKESGYIEGPPSNFDELGLYWIFSDGNNGHNLKQIAELAAENTSFGGYGWTADDFYVFLNGNWTYYCGCWYFTDDYSSSSRSVMVIGEPGETRYIEYAEIPFSEYEPYLNRWYFQ